MPKGDRRSAKLGLGEFENPLEANVVARYGFLSSIHRLAPEAVALLEQDEDAMRWAARFGLQHVPWFVEVAARTLQLWQGDPGTRRHPVWGTLGVGGQLIHQSPPVRAWEVEWESEATADARWAASKQAVREAASARGFQKTRELRNPLYIEWLVRRVIQMWTVDAIIEEYQTDTHTYDVSTIQRGINEAADLVGLPRPATLKPQQNPPSTA